MTTVLAGQAGICQDEFGNTFPCNDEDTSFWWTRTGQIVRWSIFFAILFLFLAYMIIGYWHAKRRLDKGLRPLAYHRWLLSRQQRARYDPAYQNPTVYYNQYTPAGGYYGMHPMHPMHPMPPPMYDPNAQMPPSYQPPVGATKVDPSQWRSEPTRRPAETGEPAPDYEAPLGPPPAAMRPQNTGISESSHNPYRL